MALFLITAPSGAGKTTICNEVSISGSWEEVISHTSRKPRKNEIDGITYYFVDETKFVEMKANGELAESVKYDNNYYGISKDEINSKMKKFKHVYIIVEFEGYKQIKEQYPDAIGIFLWMSKEDCMSNMLLRGDSYEKATSRIETYESEIQRRYNYDYVLKNVRDKQGCLIMMLRSLTNQYS